MISLSEHTVSSSKVYKLFTNMKDNLDSPKIECITRFYSCSGYSFAEIKYYNKKGFLSKYFPKTLCHIIIQPSGNMNGTALYISGKKGKTEHIVESFCDYNSIHDIMINKFFTNWESHLKRKR